MQEREGTLEDTAAPSRGQLGVWPCGSGRTRRRGSSAVNWARMRARREEMQPQRQFASLLCMLCWSLFSRETVFSGEANMLLHLLLGSA